MGVNISAKSPSADEAAQSLNTPSGWELAQWGGLLANPCLVFHKRQSFESRKATVVSLETQLMPHS